MQDEKVERASHHLHRVEIDSKCNDTVLRGAHLGGEILRKIQDMINRARRTVVGIGEKGQ